MFRKERHKREEWWMSPTGIYNANPPPHGRNPEYATDILHIKV